MKYARMGTVTIMHTISAVVNSPQIKYIRTQPKTARIQEMINALS